MVKKIKPKKITNKCLNCGKDFFFIFKGYGNPSSRKFCERKCSTRFGNKKYRLIRNHRAKQKLIDDPVGERDRRAKAAKKWRANHPEKSRSFNRSRIKTGELPSEDEVLFYGYKEPLRSFKGGYGYQGVLRYNKIKDKVQCHFCGRLFRAINNGHLQKVHGMTAREYKGKTGLAPTTSLVGEATREKLLVRPCNPNHMVELIKANELRKKRKAEGLKDTQSGHIRSLERYNQKGTCPDQLLDMIEKTAKSFGRTPTQEEFLNFHHGKYIGSIRRTYGTWTNALTKLNRRPQMVIKSKEELIKEIKNFYQVNKRTPKWSDFERGLLPSASTFYRNFKSINHARLLAGVPLVIQTGKMRDEYMPSEEERQRMLEKI